MLAKILSWKVGLVAALLATVAWAVVPDSTLQNQVVDKVQGLGAHGRLIAVSDQQPLGEQRYPIVLIWGLNSSTDVDGPSEAELVKMAQPVLSNWSVLYKVWTGGEFLADAKVYGFWYNSSSADPEIASWLKARVETNPELTQRVNWSAVCHSKGGNVLFCYWAAGGRKVDAKVTSGTPHLGTLMSVQAAIEQSVKKAFPLLGKWINKMIGNRGMDFESAGVKWLQPNYPAMMTLRQSHPLDETWTLLGGTVKPAGSNVVSRNLNLGLLLDRLLLEQGNSQDAQAYRIGALILSKSGVTGGSDGVVPLASARCVGYAGDAKVIQLASDYNHSEMWWGNGGLELHAEMLRPIMPYIIAHRKTHTTQLLNGFDIWLPETPKIDLPKTTIADLEKAQLVWVTQGRLVVAEEPKVESGKLAVKLQELELMAGKFTWPQWSGDNIVATREHQGKSDVVMVRVETGKLVQLTDDGTSYFAGAQDDGPLIAFESGDLMVMDSSDGLARVLVKGPLKLTSPPVFVGNRLYFAISNGGINEVRWVNPTLKERTLRQTAVVESVSQRPMKFGSAALAMTVDGEVLIISPWWTGTAPLGREVKSALDSLSGIGLPAVQIVDMANRSGNVYLVCGQDQICQVDLALVAQSFAEETEVKGWQDVVRPFASGLQLDTK